MTDFIIGPNEIENIGRTCSADPRSKEEVCVEMGVDPEALRAEAKAYAEVACGPGTRQAAKALTGVEITHQDIVAAGVAVGFELGYRACQVIRGVGGGDD